MARRIPVGSGTSHVGTAGSIALLTIAAGLFVMPAGAAEPALDSAPVQASWTALPLADVAAQLSRMTGVPVIVDRRIDPTQRITLDARGEPLGTVAAQLAAQAHADIAILAGTIRVAPQSAAAACEAGERQRAAERRRLSAAQRGTLDAAAPWQWEAAATPRELVATAAASAGIEIADLDTIPHDHFRAATLPLLPLADRLDLILFHFDQRVAWSAGPPGQRPRGRIVDLPAAAADAPRNPRAATARPAAAQQLFTLRVEAPLDEVLAAIAKRLSLTVAIDDATLRARGISPREIVRANVADASREQLLDAILAPAGLRWRIDEARLHVFAPAER
jgi:type II secretory pathway component GspD/PulD (secretin)